MKQIKNKYHKLDTTIEYLSDPVVLMQAWKKTHKYIRERNWYADILELDKSALEIEECVQRWKEEISKVEKISLELVPAAKSEQWSFESEWKPKERNNKVPIRPLANISIRDQTFSTAIMMCFADKIETIQGDCNIKDYKEAQALNVYSYGNRLFCDWKNNEAWFRWGNSDIYRKFYTDYQSFLKRPIEIGRKVSVEHQNQKDVYIVSLDIEKFYDNVDIDFLIEKLNNYVVEPDSDNFIDLISSLMNWEWGNSDYEKAEKLKLNLKNGLPQGLVSSGFFANVYMLDFDKKIGSKINKPINSRYKKRDIELHDYCRYVDDIRLVVTSSKLNPYEISSDVYRWICKILESCSKDTLNFNKDKIKIVSLEDLDNNSGMAKRLEKIQDELSGPTNRDSLESIKDILENLLSIEELSGRIDENIKDIELFQVTQYNHDINVSTLKRFASNRLENIMRAKRHLEYKDYEGKDYNQYANESELVAKKLISAWLSDPSLASVLRKAIEIYPSRELFEPVFKAIFDRSSFSKTSNNEITNSLMNFLLADLFRSGVELKNIFEKISYPESINPNEILTLFVKYALKVIKEDCPLFVQRQAYLLLAVQNVIVYAEKGDKDFINLHRILHGDTSKLSISELALFEVAGQITGEYKELASLFVEYVDNLTPNEKEFSLRTIALKGGPLWIAVWYRIRNSKRYSGLIKNFKWATPLKKTQLKRSTQFLINIVTSESNGFKNEAALIKLALGLVENLEDLEDIILKNNPRTIKVKKSTNSSWSEICHPDIKISCVFINSNSESQDPRYRLPTWLDDNLETKFLYWIGLILRSSAVGQLDYSEYRWTPSKYNNYKGIKSTWFKRRMSMFHSPEALVEEYSTVSNWFSELLMKCLQWPGFEASYIDHDDIKSIEDIQTFKEVLTKRLKYLNQMYCNISKIPTVITRVKRPENRDSEIFRLITVQQLLPRTNDFNKSDPTLSLPIARSVNTDHLMNICKIIFDTLKAKIESEDEKGQAICDLIVFPEVAVHSDDQWILKRLADKSKSIIFAGFIFLQENGALINKARWFIPSYRNSGRQWIIRDQGKEHMNANELKLGINGFRPCQHILEIVHQDETSFKISGAICYDATDISLAADLKGKTDLFIVPSHNRDVNTFDNMVSALNYHMYQHIAIANKGEFGGSTIQAPFRESFDRLIAHSHGNEQISINIADLDLKAFRRNKRKYKNVKYSPAGLIFI